MPFGPRATLDAHDAHEGHTPGDKKRGGRLKNWPTNDPHRHAFVMLGRETLFLCHMTQHWYEEHRYQVIIEAVLPPEETAKYRTLRHDYPDDSFFLANLGGGDTFTLPSLQAGDRKEMRCEVFRGIPATDKPRYTAWPWNGVKPVIPNVTVSIKRIVHYRPFSDKMNYPTTLCYLLFGAGNEAHMTNWQTKEPEFDHVVSLQEAPSSWLPQDQLKAGVIVDIPGQETESSHWPQALCRNPWPKATDKEPTAQFVRYRGEENELPVQIGRTSWFSLKVANMSNPCANGGEQWPPRVVEEASPPNAGEGEGAVHV